MDHRKMKHPAKFCLIRLNTNRVVDVNIIVGFGRFFLRASWRPVFVVCSSGGPH